MRIGFLVENPVSIQASWDDYEKNIKTYFENLERIIEDTNEECSRSTCNFVLPEYPTFSDSIENKQVIVEAKVESPTHMSTSVDMAVIEPSIIETLSV
jgi:hypothetical protein